MPSFVRALLAGGVLAIVLALQPLDTPATEAAGPGTWTPAADVTGGFESHITPCCFPRAVMLAGNAHFPFWALPCATTR